MINKKNLLIALSSILIATTANAGVVYDNGPINGSINAWTINNVYSVANQFTLTATTDVTSVSFGTWNYPGDTLTNVNWAIVDSPSLTATTYANGVQTSVAGSYAGSGWGHFDLNLNTFSTGNIELGAGSYWLLLSNATTSHGSRLSGI